MYRLKVAIYCRADAPKTSPSALAIAAQRAYLTAYAEEKHMEVVGVFKDDGVSGRSLNRPGLQGAMQTVNTGQADLLLAVDRNRLFRGIMPAKLRKLPIRTLKERSMER